MSGKESERGDVERDKSNPNLDDKEVPENPSLHFYVHFPETFIGFYNVFTFDDNSLITR